MDDTLSNDMQGLALELARVLTDHGAVEPVVLDLRTLNAWTDFFIVAGATSSTHMGGLKRHALDYCAERKVSPRHARGKHGNDDAWNLIDLGGVVVHLMTAEARSFYELERLWNEAAVLEIPTAPQARSPRA